MKAAYLYILLLSRPRAVLSPMTIYAREQLILENIVLIAETNVHICTKQFELQHATKEEF